MTTVVSGPRITSVVAGSGGRRDRLYDEVLVGCVLAEGAALAVLVGTDGSALARVSRVALTAILTAAAGRAVLDRRPARHVWALLAGLTGVVTGVGVGVRHLTVDGVSVAALAGIIALAAGVVLLVAAGIGLVRRLPGWWRLLALPVAYVVLAAVVLPAIGATMATNVPPTALGAATPESRGLSYEDVSLRTSDGVRLSAWYVPSSNGAAVVLLHGATETRSNVLAQAAVLARHGYGTLLLDARGHGLSSGRAMDFGWYGDRDVAAAVDYLAARPDVVGGRIGVLGLSMGGEEALGAAAADRRIRAVVAEGATNRVAGDKAWLPSTPDGWSMRATAWVTYTLADLLSDASPPITLRTAVVRTAPRPVLLIAAGNVGEETDVGRHLRAAAPASVQLWTVPGAAHTHGLSVQPARWEARVTSFLDGALHPRTTGTAVRQPR